MHHEREPSFLRCYLILQLSDHKVAEKRKPGEFSSNRIRQPSSAKAGRLLCRSSLLLLNALSGQVVREGTR